MNSSLRSDPVNAKQPMKTIWQVVAKAHGFHGSWRWPGPKASTICGLQIPPSKQAGLNLSRKYKTETKQKYKLSFFPICYQLITNSVFTSVLQNTSLKFYSSICKHLLIYLTRKCSYFRVGEKKSAFQSF